MKGVQKVSRILNTPCTYHKKELVSKFANIHRSNKETKMKLNILINKI